jgi:hypothetical protein
MNIPYRSRHALWLVPFLCGNASAISWDYADFAYVADGKSFGVSSNQSSYLSGTSLDTAFSVHQNVHVRAMARAWNARLALPPPDGYVNVALNDWHSAGVGVNYPFAAAGADLNVWAELSLDHYFVGSAVGTGFGYAVGVRSRWQDTYEAGLWFRQGRTGLSDVGDVDLNPSAYGLDLLYSLSPRTALRLGWSIGELEVDAGGPTEKYDVRHTEIGLRYLFDRNTGGAATAQQPLGYSDVHIAYALAGGLEDSNAGIDWDVRSGISLGFRVAPWEHVFLGARYDGRSYDAEGMGGLNSLGVANQLTAGPGAFYTVHQGDLSWSGYTQLTYNRIATIEGLVLQGYGARLGARAAWRSRLEADLFLVEGKTRARFSGDTSRLDPSGFGLTLAATPFDNGLAFTLGYEQIDFEGTIAGGTDLKLETDQWLLGVRQSF